MNSTHRNNPSPGHHTAVRLIAAINFVLFVVVFFTPLGGEEAYRAYKAAKIDDLLTWTIQAWVVGSTLVATVLLIRGVIRLRRSKRILQEEWYPLQVDAMVLAFWWITLFGLGLYGFMLGLRAWGIPF